MGNRARLIAAVAVLSATVTAGSTIARPTPAALAAPPAANVGGSWSGVGLWDFIPLHAALSPDGSLLTYGLRGDVRAYDTWTPPTNEVALGDGFWPGHDWNLDSTGSRLYCSIIVSDPTSNGLMILGGTNDAPNGAPFNNRLALRYNDGEISEVPELEQMRRPRWYPSAVTLWDGRILVQGGTDDLGPNEQPRPGQAIVVPEIFTEDRTWKLLEGATSEAIYGRTNADEAYNYPRSWITPTGRIFGFTGSETYWISPEGTGAIEKYKNISEFGVPRVIGSTSAAVMYEEGKILQVGGGEAGAGAIVIDLTPVDPTIRTTTPMNFPRVSADATVLPDGRVLVSGGSSVSNELVDVAYAPEVWNPADESWTVWTANEIPRLYHSAAVLLPDATVWTGGGGNPGPADPDDLNGDGNTDTLDNLNAEIFYPPYLFDANGNRSARPVISGVPAILDHGAALNLTVGSSGGRTDHRISKVTLVRNGNSTHSTNSQQLLTLDSNHTGTRLQVTGPRNAFVAPPGDYHLYAVDTRGVPSVGVPVRVEAQQLQPLDPLRPGDGTVPAGRVRISSELNPTSGFLTQRGQPNPDGSWSPSRLPGLAAYLDPSTGEPRRWESLQWEFIPAERDLYRVRNRWAPDRGYLTRLGSFQNGAWQPQPGVRLEPYAPDWGSQKWTVERNGAFVTLTNQWYPGTGVLTSDGSTVWLADANGGASQRWTITPY